MTVDAVGPSSRYMPTPFVPWRCPPSSVTGVTVAVRLHSVGCGWTELFRALTRPTLVIPGEVDLLPAADARALVRVPRLALFPGLGHMRFWEAPAHFLFVVESFLSSGDPPE